MQKKQRIVVKIGTSTLTDGSKKINLPNITGLAQQIAALIAEGNQVAFVSSGAIAAGRESLGYPELPKTIPGKQMLAAIGQPRLMAIYEQLFGIYGCRVAQLLLTREDISDRKRYLNARGTLEALLSQQVVPIINENDTVATEEIRIGDNDNLSALVSNLIEADMLILLTDQEGIFTGDPARVPDAKLISEITEVEIPKSIWEAAGGSRSGLGTGGMWTKLEAAEIARRSGTTVVIAKGGEPGILLQLVHGEKKGSYILPTVDKLESRKRYMLASVKPRSIIKIDNGALKALLDGGSLLPVGVADLQGQFERGDIVKVKSMDGKDYALGISNYSVKDLKVIKGCRSSEIEKLLGYGFGDEVIHHNNMAIMAGRHD